MMFQHVYRYQNFTPSGQTHSIVSLRLVDDKIHLHGDITCAPKGNEIAQLWLTVDTKQELAHQ